MRIYSLTDKDDFRQLFRSGQRLGSGFFRLITRKNSIGHSRFAFITPSSLDKRSTVRNRLRRRAREWIRKNAVLDLDEFIREINTEVTNKVLVTGMSNIWPIVSAAKVMCPDCSI